MCIATFALAGIALTGKAGLPVSIASTSSVFQGTEEDRRSVAAQARAVAGDQHVGGQCCALRAAEVGQTRRTGLFAGLDEPLHVEPEPAAQLQHLRQRGDVAAVLALVVGAAAAVEAFAVLRQRPPAPAPFPARVLAADDVAVAVDQHRGQRVALVAAGGQKRAVAAVGVRVPPAGEARSGQRGRHLVGQVGLQRRARARLLALGADGDTPRQVAREGAVVEVLDGGLQRGAAAHDFVTSSKCSTTGGAAKKGPTMARHSGKSAPPRKATVWSSSVLQNTCRM